MMLRSSFDSWFVVSTAVMFLKPIVRVSYALSCVNESFFSCVDESLFSFSTPLST